MGAGASVENVGRVEAVFSTIDANCSGTLDVKELKKFLTGFVSKPHVRAEEWLNNFDADKDGQVLYSTMFFS